MLSCALVKFGGKSWQDGTAMYYVVHNDSFYGKLFAPDFLFGYMRSLEILTYKTLVIELLAPLTLWFESTRNMTLVFLFLFHLGIDLAMNLEFFHWIMIVGWSAFLAQPLQAPSKDTGKANGEANEKAITKSVNGVDKDGSKEQNGAAAASSPDKKVRFKPGPSPSKKKKTKGKKR